MQNTVHYLFGFMFALIALLFVALAQTPAPTALSDEWEPEPVRDDRPMRSCLNCEE